MALIDIGAAVIDRNSYTDLQWTKVEGSNPANDTGKINSVEMWLFRGGTNVEVATFIDEGSNVLSTRDYEVLGTVSVGSKQTFSGLDMAVATGDYIGIYASGDIECDISGGPGMWGGYGDEIPCTSETFAWVGGYILSLYGTGTTLQEYERSLSSLGGLTSSRASVVVLSRSFTLQAGLSTVLGRLLENYREISTRLGLAWSWFTQIGKTWWVKIGLRTTLQQKPSYVRLVLSPIGITLVREAVTEFFRLMFKATLGLSVTRISCVGTQLVATIGAKVVVSRFYAVTRVMTLLVGLTGVLRQITEYRRVLAVLVGFALSRTVNFGRMVSSTIGVTPSLDRLAQFARSNIASQGLVSSAVLRSIARAIGVIIGLFIQRYQLKFDSTSDDYVDIGSGSSLNPTVAVSVEVWITPSLVSGHHGIVGDEVDWGNHYHLYLRDEAGARIAFGIDSANYIRTGNVLLNTRQHIVGTYSKANNKLYLYLQGSQIGEAVATIDIPTSAENVLIGKIGLIDIPQVFHGFLDEVRIYNRALSPTEVQEHFNGEFKNEAGLVGFWRFEEGSGNTAYDSSGQGNDGTITGATWSGLPFERYRTYGSVRSFSALVGTTPKLVRGIRLRALLVTVGLKNVLVEIGGFTRAFSSLVGLSTLGSRLGNIVRLLVSNLSLSPPFEEALRYLRALSASIGLIAIHARTFAITRVIGVGIVFGRLLDTAKNEALFERTLQALIGMTSSVAKLKTFVFSISAAIGITPIRSLVIESLREMTALVGLSPARSRVFGASRGLANQIGLAVFVRRILKFMWTLPAGSGLVSFTTKGISRNVSATTGLASSFARRIGRSLGVGIGVVSSVGRRTTIMRMGEVLLEIVSTLTRTIEGIRVLSPMLSLVAVFKLKSYTFVLQVGVISSRVYSSTTARILSTSAGALSIVTRRVEKAYTFASRVGLTGVISRSLDCLSLVTTCLGMVAIGTKLHAIYQTFSTRLGGVVSVGMQVGFSRSLRGIVNFTITVGKWSKAVGYKTLKFFRLGWIHYG